MYKLKIYKKIKSNQNIKKWISITKMVSILKFKLIYKNSWRLLRNYSFDLSNIFLNNLEIFLRFWEYYGNRSRRINKLSSRINIKILEFKTVELGKIKQFINNIIIKNIIIILQNNNKSINSIKIS